MNKLNSVTIVGVGLIGGSVGLALRRRLPDVTIVGVGSRETSLRTALERGAITEIASDLPAAVAQADLVIVCAPVDHIVRQVQALAPHCRPGTLITDAGSTKAEIVAALAGKPGWHRDVRFVGSHPLAGNEKTGPQHASAELFVDRVVVVTPEPATQADHLAAIHEFWRLLGARVIDMSPEEHDQALATTSHLPHLLAAVIAGSTPESYLPLTGSGWRDTTRIAAGDPALWRQIMLSNRQHLLTALDCFASHLPRWRAALASSDAVELERLLAEAKRLRDSA